MGRLFPDNPRFYDLPFDVKQTKWIWDEENLAFLASLFCKEFDRDDLVVIRLHGLIDEWGLTYKEPGRVPIITADTHELLGKLGMAYLAGYRNAANAVEQQDRWIRIARQALDAVEGKPRM